jgi:hypothetical protein
VCRRASRVSASPDTWPLKSPAVIDQ